MAMGDYWLLLLPLVVLLLCGALIYLEECYYARHPEKERPDMSMYP